MPLPVASGNWFEICEHVRLGEETKFDFIAGDIYESGTWLENLPEDGMDELGETGAGDVDEG